MFWFLIPVDSEERLFQRSGPNGICNPNPRPLTLLTPANPNWVHVAIPTNDTLTLTLTKMHNR